MRKYITLILIIIAFSSCSDEFNDTMDVLFCFDNPSRSERVLFVKEKIQKLPATNFIIDCQESKELCYTVKRSHK